MKLLLCTTTILIVTTFFSCKNKSDSSDSTKTESVKQSESDSNMFVYPIKDYVQGQIGYVDSMPLAIEKQTFINNRRTDSVIIDRAAFRQIANEFMQPDLTANGLHKQYNLSQFNDLTINTLTFSYSAKNPDAELQQQDVLLDPETQRVKNIMFRRIEHRGDTTFTINGLWKHNMNFQLNYIIEPGSGPMQTKQIKVIWDRPIQ